MYGFSLTLVISLIFGAVVGAGTVYFFKKNKEKIIWWQVAAWAGAAFLAGLLIGTITE